MYNSDAKLKALLDITNAINDNKGVNDLLDLFTYVLSEIIGIDKFVLIQCIPNWEITKAYKLKKKNINFNFQKELCNFTSVTHLENTDGNLAMFDEIIPVYHKQTAIAFLLISHGKPQIDLDFTQTLTNVIAVAIENKRLAKLNLVQEIAKHDLNFAAEVQRYLVPDLFEKNKHIQVHGVYMPHNQIGGDYYDLIPSGDDYYFCMADVSGKGVSAAILMANFQAQLRTLIQYTSLPIDDLILELNKRVNLSVNGEKFITIFLAKYETHTRKLTYVNAGHNPPILIEKNNSRLLSKGSIGLGMMRNLPFLNVIEFQTEPGAVICCYTDGIIEQLNDQGVEFDLDRLEKIVMEYHNFHPSLINAGVIKQVEIHRGTQPYNDDISLFSCRFV